MLFGSKPLVFRLRRFRLDCKAISLCQGMHAFIALCGDVCVDLLKPRSGSVALLTGVVGKARVLGLYLGLVVLDVLVNVLLGLGNGLLVLLKEYNQYALI